SVEVYRALGQADRLRDAQAGAVQQLHQGTVAQRPRADAGGRVDQTLGLRRRERARQRPGAARQRQRGGRVVLPDAEQDEVAAVGARRGRPAGDGRGGEAVRAHLREPALELRGGRLADRPPAERRQPGQVAPVGVDRARRPLGGEEQQEALDVRVADRHGGLIRPRSAIACSGGGSGRGCAAATRHDRGCERSYTRRSRRASTWLYTWVVESEAWPSSSWMTRRSAPPSSRCVAYAWRRRCGLGTSRRSTLVSSRRPRAERKTASAAPRARRGRASRR